MILKFVLVIFVWLTVWYILRKKRLFKGNKDISEEEIEIISLDRSVVVNVVFDNDEQFDTKIISDLVLKYEDIVKDNFKFPKVDEGKQSIKKDENINYDIFMDVNNLNN